MAPILGLKTVTSPELEYPFRPDTTRDEFWSKFHYQSSDLVEMNGLKHV